MKTEYGINYKLKKKSIIIIRFFNRLKIHFKLEVTLTYDLKSIKLCKKMLQMNLKKKNYMKN